ncbi:MAG TPA: penicillin acylase family protein [Deltaproteobacteria bacterium]|nr:penicillin acylase family protein [Deltaproteobacteria bacterium]
MKKRMVKTALILFSILLLLVAGGLLFLYGKLQSSLPVLEGERIIATLDSPVTVSSDRFGISTIRAASRFDAFRALGYVTARDRLFQMDMMRRAASGRLSEVIGKLALKIDVEHRVMGFNRVASKIAQALPEEQRKALSAYAEGVNAFIQQMETPPIEFILLGYRPAPWAIEDSVLVYLNIFEDLYGHSDSERMMTVMKKTLPPEVVEFLTPDTSVYAVPLMGGDESFRPIRPIPAAALSAIRKLPPEKNHKEAQLLETKDVFPGSNQWAVGGSRTPDGRAILANDMHLGLRLPNIWYRASLQYEGGTEISGVTLPGTPPIIIGSNGQVAWGFTVLMADILDLVKLEINPENPAEYKTPEGWKPFELIQEAIQVRWGKDAVIEVRGTIWGPVLETKVAGEPVALHWSVLESGEIDMGLLAMDGVENLEEGMGVLNRFRGPPLNALIADKEGKIAWTATGRIPIRKGFDGTSSESWADGSKAWIGYIPPDQLPRVVNPPSGFLVTANNRTLGKDYPYPIGYDFAVGYRAYRIHERLQAIERTTEPQMFSLQLDTTSHFFDFYRDLALRLLTEKTVHENPLLLQAKQAIEAWDGRADTESRGFGLLVRFRQILDKDVFDPFLTSCREADAAFSYVWHNRETPLRAMLSAEIPETNPDPEHYPNWDAFLLGKLTQAVNEIKEEYRGKAIEQLSWGDMNRAHIVEPLFGEIPLFGRLFKMPEDPLSGCLFCVRVSASSYGASERMVVSPGHDESGILHMPAGQSGHPLSPHYRDQHPYWVQGKPLPFLPGKAIHTLILKPAVGSSAR